MLVELKKYMLVVRTMKTSYSVIAMMILAIAVVGGYFLWANSGKKSEKFTVYRPDPSKNTWARDTVLTQVLSSGRLA